MTMARPMRAASARPSSRLAPRRAVARASRSGRTPGGAGDARRERQAELEARTAAVSAARKLLEQIAEERGLSEEAGAFLNARHAQRERLIPSALDDGAALMRAHNDLRLELIAAERDFIYELLRSGKITDESRRRLGGDLDLEE